MKYKGYEAIVEDDEDAGTFHGDVANLGDVITCRGRSLAEIEKTLAGSIEDYLAFCRERGEEPERPLTLPRCL
jgi:predicted HicB family RNase H-like nuclease